MMMGGNIVLDLLVPGVRDDLGMLKQCDYLIKEHISVWNSRRTRSATARPHLPEKHFAHILLSQEAKTMDLPTD